MVSQKSLATIFSYLEKFRTGQLKHDQRFFFGDEGACCLAGWITLHALEEKGFTFTNLGDYSTLREIESTVKKLSGSYSIWNFASEQLDLDFYTSMDFFKADLTLDELYTNLQNLCKEKNISYPPLNSPLAKKIVEMQQIAIEAEAWKEKVQRAIDQVNQKIPLLYDAKIEVYFSNIKKPKDLNASFVVARGQSKISTSGIFQKGQDKSYLETCLLECLRKIQPD